MSIYGELYGALSCRARWKANLQMFVLMFLIYYYAVEARGNFSNACVLNAISRLPLTGVCRQADMARLCP